MPFSAKKILLAPSALFVLLLISTYIVFAQDSITGQTSLSGQNCPEPPSGLVSRWNGDSVTGKSESERNIVADMKAINNGRILGGVTIRPWENGNNFHPNGSNGYIRMENSKSLNFGTGPFSLEAWFRLGVRGRGYPAGSLIRKSNYPVKGPGSGYWLKAGGDDRILEFHVGETTGIPGEPRGRITTTINADTWYYVVATRDSAGVMKLYVDGKLKGTAEATAAETTSEAPFTLGAWDDRFGVTEPFFGVIGGVSVYNKALSQSEVISAFNVGNDSRCQSYLGAGPQKLPVPEPVALSKITYPVQELGNCASKQECKAYCSISSNYSKCAAFAQKNGLTVEVPDDRKGVFAAMQKGESPGQCKDELSCRSYCEDIDHLEECVSFVEKFNLASSDELKEIRQMASVKKAGVAFPGNCKTKESCLAYCENSAHAVECMEFALRAGFIPKEDAESVGKIIPYLKSGGKLPGGCTTKESCDVYCDSDTHTNECVDFAIQAGFMTREEAEIVKKTGGKGPGNCRSREACDNYCKSEAHIDECVDFAVKAGFISEEEAEMAKKFKITSGPGGCKGKAECEAFCVVNQDVCFDWAKEHGMDVGGGPGNAEECAKYGGDWDGKRCELGASECVKQGGIWGLDNETGKETCNFPGGMGQDNRKDFEACLSKATCAEFNVCFGAIPKGNQQQQSGPGGQQEPQDEIGKKIKTRVTACFEEKMDSCLVLSCSEFETCLKSFQQGGGEQSGEQQQGQGAPNPKVDAKINACQKELQEIKMKEVQEKMDACLSYSCSEFESCLKSVQQGSGEGQQGEQQSQGTPDPKLEAKFQACQKEKVNACLAKPCGEFQTCLNSLGGGGEQSGQQQGAPDPAVQSKFMSCFPPPPSGGGQ